MTRAEFSKILLPIRKLILDRMIFEGDVTLLRFMSPNHDQQLQSFMNHSDTPNSVDLTTTRNIKEGEEITEDFRCMAVHPDLLSRKHHQYL